MQRSCSLGRYPAVLWNSVAVPGASKFVPLPEANSKAPFPISARTVFTHRAMLLCGGNRRLQPVCVSSAVHCAGKPVEGVPTHGQSRAVSSASGSEESAKTGEARKLTPEECLLSLRMTVETLESPDLESALFRFRASDDVPTDRTRLFELVNAWQNALSIAQRVQMEAIARFGFESTSAGLLAYEQQLHKMADIVGKEMGVLKQRKWQAVLLRIFRLEQRFDLMPVEYVRDVTKALSEAVQSVKFAAKLEVRLEKLEKLGAGSTQSDRRRVVIEDLLREHFRVLDEFGYHGETGYLRFQAVVMDHVTDRVVAENVAAGSSSVLKIADEW